jgi:hypothetical protein
MLVNFTNVRLIPTESHQTPETLDDVELSVQPKEEKFTPSEYRAALVSHYKLDSHVDALRFVAIIELNKSKMFHKDAEGNEYEVEAGEVIDYTYN